MTRDDLLAASITRGLGTAIVGRRIIRRRRLPSTNELAKAEARRGATEGTVVITDEQTAGKGRLKRQWLSPPGNIALTIILAPTVPQLPSLIMLASLAVVRCVREVAGLAAGIKWPNDVLIGGKKVSGILVESSVRGSAVDYAVIGIGLNVKLDDILLADIGQAATSLANELGRDVSRLELVRCLLSGLDKLYLDLKAGHSPYEEWRSHLVTLGNKVRVTSGEDVYEGIAETAAPDGSLLVRLDDGRLQKIVAGDVATLRERGHRFACGPFLLLALLAGFSLHEHRYQVNGQGEDDGAVFLRGDLHQGLEIA